MRDSDDLTCISRDKCCEPVSVSRSQWKSRGDPLTQITCNAETPLYQCLLQIIIGIEDIFWFLPKSRSSEKSHYFAERREAICTESGK
jgi:hypothetical protein